MVGLDLQTLLAVPNLNLYQKQVDNRLVKVIGASNLSIKKPAMKLIQAPSKRLRSVLAMSAALGLGQEIDNKLISSCVAIELIHLGSLVHDDIIDNAVSRWNKPTIFKSEGLGQSIVIGDYLFAKACEEAAGVSQEAAALISATITKLCDGQSQEIKDQHKQNRSINSMQAAVKGKTAALFAASCQMAGLIAGLNATRLTKLESYGLEFGVSYQYLDDVLDFISSPKLLGKPTYGDIRAGVYTLPLLLALNGPSGKKVRSLISDTVVNIPNLIEILISTGSLESAVMTARKHTKLAKRSINKLSDYNSLDALSEFPLTYLNWTLKYQVKKMYQPSISKILN